MSTVDALVDTSILIDLSRGDARAQVWSQGMGQQVLGLHVLVSMELAEGVSNKAELTRLDAMLSRYEAVTLTPSDCFWALDQHRKLRLSHGVGLIDALIASSAVRLNVPLYTLNLKHFSPLPALKVQRPY